MPHKTEISKQGNGLAVRLPTELVDKLGLVQGDLVTLNLNGGCIEITRAELDYNRATDLGRKSATRYRRAMAKLAK